MGDAELQINAALGTNEKRDHGWRGERHHSHRRPEQVAVRDISPRSGQLMKPAMTLGERDQRPYSLTCFSKAACG